MHWQGKESLGRLLNTRPGGIQDCSFGGKARERTKAGGLLGGDFGNTGVRLYVLALGRERQAEANSYSIMEKELVDQMGDDIPGAGRRERAKATEILSHIDLLGMRVTRPATLAIYVFWQMLCDRFSYIIATKA